MTVKPRVLKLHNDVAQDYIQTEFQDFILKTAFKASSFVKIAENPSIATRDFLSTLSVYIPRFLPDSDGKIAIDVNKALEDLPSDTPIYYNVSAKTR